MVDEQYIDAMLGATMAERSRPSESPVACVRSTTARRSDDATAHHSHGERTAHCSGTDNSYALERTERSANTDDLLILHQQAVEARLISAGEAGQLDFLAYAERARAHGTRPGALFVWLLRGRQTKFITQADEDAALARLREYRAQKDRQAFRASAEQGRGHDLSEDERIYTLCIRVAKQHRMADPFRVAMMTHNWTRDRWDSAQQSLGASKAGGSSIDSIFEELDSRQASR